MTKLICFSFESWEVHSGQATSRENLLKAFHYGRGYHVVTGNLDSPSWIPHVTGKVDIPALVSLSCFKNSFRMDSGACSRQVLLEFKIQATGQASCQHQQIPE